MPIVPVSADDPKSCRDRVALAAAVDAGAGVAAHPETPASIAAWLRHGHDGDAPRLFLLRDDDGSALGCVDIESSRFDNPQLAWLTLNVAPAHRRRGAGTRLLDFALQTVKESGQTSVVLTAWDAPATRAFAARHGLGPRAVDVLRRQDLAALDRPALDGVEAEARAASTGYELLRIAHAMPEALVADYSALAGSMNDAPFDDLDLQDEDFSPVHVRAIETATRNRDRDMYYVLARRVSDGALAAHTWVQVEHERPAIGWQGDTSVAREHRGHRLGALVKLDLMRWLAEAEPALRTIDTWNAESNSFMVGVNERLQYRVLGRCVAFQRDL